MVKQRRKSKASKSIDKKRKDKLGRPKKPGQLSEKRKKHKKGTSNLGSFIDVNDFNEQALKETPKQKKKAANSAGNEHKARIKKRKTKSSNEFLTAQEIDDKVAAKNELQKRRLNRKKSNKFAGLISKLALFFDKKKGKAKSNKAVFKFAGKEKRAGKKRLINKRTAIYAGAGLLAAAALLAAFLIPWGGTAPADAQATEMAMETGEPTLAEVSQAVDAASEVEITTASPTPSAIPTTEPDPTPVPVVMEDLIEEFMVEADLYYNDVGYSTNYYEYTEEEMYMLAQIIQIESGGESYEGKIAVGNVVMNRVLCRGYPGSSITAVITRPGQFAYEKYKDRAPKSSARAAARAVLDDENWVIAQNVYFFRSGAGEGDWGSHPFYKKIGGHRFYTHRYSGRNRNEQIPPSLFERTYKWPRYGCKPEDRVHKLQLILNSFGYDVYADSYFGKDTMIALKEFQAKKGLEADGIAGPATIEALIREYGVEEYYLEVYI